MEQQVYLAETKVKKVTSLKFLGSFKTESWPLFVKVPFLWKKCVQYSRPSPSGRIISRIQYRFTYVK